MKLRNNETVNNHLLTLKKELERVKKVEIPMVKINFGNTQVEVNLESGFVSGKTPFGLSFADAAKIAQSEIEEGIWNGESCEFAADVELREGECLCTGVAMYRSPGRTERKLYFRLAPGSRWSPRSEFWIQFGSGRKPQEVRDAISSGKFAQLPGLLGCRVLVALKVQEKQGPDGRIYPEIVLTSDDAAYLDSLGKQGQFDSRPYIPFKKSEVYWVTRKKVDNKNVA